MNDTQKEILKNLMLIQKEIDVLTKTKDNPFYKSKYVDLQTILEVLKDKCLKHNLAFMQYTSVDNGVLFLNTQFVDINNGESIEYKTGGVLPFSDTQKLGGAITYLRRYSLVGLFAIQEEDDDGNTAVKPNFAICPKGDVIGELWVDLPIDRLKKALAKVDWLTNIEKYKNEYAKEIGKAITILESKAAENKTAIKNTSENDIVKIEEDEDVYEVALESFDNFELSNESDVK